LTVDKERGRGEGKNLGRPLVAARGQLHANEIKKFLGYHFVMKKPLHIVGDTDLSPVQPPRSLGKHGRSLWDRIVSEYVVDDCAGIELLTQACQACDRAEALAAAVERDGEIIRTPTGIKSHPGIREELAARAFVVRTLSRLGLNYEPLRSAPGRSPGS
jgi:hypothetical protein